MIETVFDENHVVQVPAIEDLVEQKNTDILVIGPCIGGETHQLDHPELCWCFPQFDIYSDENNLVGLIVVQHKWEQ